MQLLACTAPSPALREALLDIMLKKVVVFSTCILIILAHTIFKLLLIIRLTFYLARGHFVYIGIFLENVLGIESHTEQIGWKSWEKGTQLRKGKLKQNDLK